MLIDTHTHLNFKAYDADRESVIERCGQKSMSVINVGAQFNTSKLAVELSGKHDFLYAAIGLHPIHVFDEEFKPADYQKLINQKVIAIGETGLDFWHFEAPDDLEYQRSTAEIISKQKEVFLKHIELGKENNLPLICHGRDGLEEREVYGEMLEILLEQKVERAVFHCFGGSLAMAEKIISHGYYLGIDGPVTFKKKAEDLQELARKIPLENILIETDCPYLTPEPHRGERNEPTYVEFVAEKIAELKNLSKEEVVEQTWQNAKKLFKI